MRNKLFIMAMIALGVLVGVLIMSQAEKADAAISATTMRNLPVDAVGTNIHTWRAARSAAVTADDTTPDPNGQTWQAANGSYYDISSYGNTISLAFYCYGDGTGDGDANGGSFDANVYLVEPYGSWEQVASFTCAVGELELTHNPVTGAALNSGSLDPNQSYKWVEGPFTDNLSDTDIWPTTVNLSGATNTIGRMNIDPLGCVGLVVLIDNMASITSVTPIVKER